MALAARSRKVHLEKGLFTFLYERHEYASRLVLQIHA